MNYLYDEVENLTDGQQTPMVARDIAGRDSINAIVTKKPLNLFNKADLDNESISSVKPGSGIRTGKGLNMTIKKVPAGDWGIDEVKFQAGD
jgi:hypothetical protein